MFKKPIICNSLESLILFLRLQVLRFTLPKYFHRDAPGYQPLPFKEIIRKTTVSVRRLPSRWELTTNYKKEVRSLQIELINGYQPTKPVFIYHHGAGETKPYRDLNVVFGPKFYGNFNAFLVRAQYHNSRKEYLEHSVDSFLHHQQTFAGSILAYEEIIKYHRKKSSQPVIATGVSMGGIVSALHAFYFGTADYYFPLVAYPNVGEIFLGREYRTVVDNWADKQKNQAYFRSFEIEKIDPELTDKVFPVLGRYDRIVPFDKASRFWKKYGFQIKIYPYGHFGPGIFGKEIRKYLETCVKDKLPPSWNN